MPLYEYSCHACGSAFERRLSFSNRLQAQACPKCDETETELLMSAPARPGVTAGGQAASVCPSTGQSCGCPMPGMN